MFDTHMTFNRILMGYCLMVQQGGSLFIKPRLIPIILLALLMHISWAGVALASENNNAEPGVVMLNGAEAHATSTEITEAVTAMDDFATAQTLTTSNGIAPQVVVAVADASVASSPVDPLCGSSEVISCSVYAKLKGVRDPIRKLYSDKFHAACAYHDWCYRYGHATYERSKADCDNLFLTQMQDICSQVNWSTVLIPRVSTATCRQAAGIFFGAVKVAPDAEKSYQQGKAQCAYDGFCPSGKFETTGFLHNCRCPTGHKVHTGLAKETAYCTGTVACPPGRFSTTGRLRGCYCPEGKPKDYEVLTGNAYAQCKGFDVACPSGKFGTTGKNRGCDCPRGTRKDYLDIFKAKARCIETDSGGGGGGGGGGPIIRQN